MFPPLDDVLPPGLIDLAPGDQTLGDLRTVPSTFSVAYSSQITLGMRCTFDTDSVAVLGWPHRPLVEGRALLFEVPLREGATRAGLQVALEAEGRGFVGEVNGREDFPGPITCRVRATARVMGSEASVHVVCEADVRSIWFGDAPKDVNDVPGQHPAGSATPWPPPERRVCREILDSGSTWWAVFARRWRAEAGSFCQGQGPPSRLRRFGGQPSPVCDRELAGVG